MAYLGENIPKLGFGLMRLPEYEVDGKKNIDIEQVKDMVDLFLESGFTYFDTAFGYHGGRSEKAVKEVLVERYPRECFQLATKLPAWAAQDAASAKTMFAKSLERTGAGYFDFYLLHNLGQRRTQAFEDFGIWDFALEQKKKGLIKHFGFSFHDKAAALEEVLKAHPEAEFVQLQINYADWESPAIEARKCYELARSYGKSIVIMEPVRGGSLARLPEQIAALFPDIDLADAAMAEEDKESILASWALRYAASLEGVITVLSGMSTLDQVRDNAKVMKNFKSLDDAERGVLSRVQQALAESPRIPCTDCRYCLEGCPKEINIPGILNALNIYLTFGDLKRARESYSWQAEKGPASLCISCGSCEEACPQHISIQEELKRAEIFLEK